MHEYSHALYFVDPSFRKIVHDQWQVLKPEERRFLRGAMIASGFYASGEEWLIETEVQAHGIADPVSDDGFVNIMAYAVTQCGSQPKGKGCDDFYSYEGDIRGALHKISDGYRTASECNVPFTSDWAIEDGLLTRKPFPDHCAEVSVPSGEEDDMPSEAENEYAIPSSGTIPRLKIDIPGMMDTINGFGYTMRRQQDQVNNPRFSDLLDNIQRLFDRRHSKK